MFLNTINDIRRLNNLFNRVFFEDDYYRDYRFNDTGYENDTSYHIVIPASGVNKEDIKLEVINNSLNIEFERKLPKYENPIRLERRSYKYSKSFELPENANTEDITAHVENGVLNIIIAKKEKAQPKKIEVKVK